MKKIKLTKNHIAKIYIKAPSNFGNKEKGYNVYFSDSYDDLPNILKSFDIKNKKICIVSDTTVSSHFLNGIVDLLSPFCNSVFSFILPDGEQSKSFETVEVILKYLLMNDFDREDMILSLGGGVTGDISGFCASIYMRGIKYINIPTSLLSQTDSSVGGKCAVDIMSYKNIAGSFYQPSLVYINIQAIDLLDYSEKINGMSEVIKDAIIGDSEFFSYLEDSVAKDVCNEEFLLTIIYHSILIKKDYVEKDPFDKNRRNILNFGHTIGHGIEKISSFQISHGQAISIGMVAASKIALDLGYINDDSFYRIINLLNYYKLPVTINLSDNQIEELLNIIQSDKKNVSGEIKFILLNKIGEGIIVNNISLDIIKKTMEYLR